MNRRLRGALLWALVFAVSATAAPAEEAASWPLLRLQLAGPRERSSLRVDRVVQVEWGVAGGVERVLGRIARIDTLGAAVWLEVEPQQPVLPSDAGRVQGLLLREDHARAGASVGWVVGSLLALWAAEQATGEGMSLLPRRGVEIGAGIVGGLLGRLGGRWLGRRWTTTRGVAVVASQAIE